MTLVNATRIALVNAQAAAALAKMLVPPNPEPRREHADELITLAGRLLCAAREMQARIMGVPEAHRGD